MKSRLADAKKRVQELEKLICRIYEDNILGKLPDGRYAILDGQYSKEQKDLSAEIADMEAGVITKPKKDYELSRYACYLIVQNGDPRKEVVALGQTYFAICNFSKCRIYGTIRWIRC